MVPGAGLEPARYYYRQILSLLCLPIPPPGQKQLCILHVAHQSLATISNIAAAVSMVVVEVGASIAVNTNADTGAEAEVGIEPAYTDLQSAA